MQKRKVSSLCKSLSCVVARCAYAIYLSRKNKDWDKNRELLTCTHTCTRARARAHTHTHPLSLSLTLSLSNLHSLPKWNCSARHGCLTRNSPFHSQCTLRIFHCTHVASVTPRGCCVIIVSRVVKNLFESRPSAELPQRG